MFDLISSLFKPGNEFSASKVEHSRDLFHLNA